MNGKRVVRSLISALIATVVVFGGMVGFALFSGNKPDLSYRTLDYEATVQSDGSIRVTQDIDMQLRKRDGDRPWKQLFQQYTLKPARLTNITDISVRNITAGEQYRQGQVVNPADIDDATWDSDYAGRWYIADVTTEDDPQPYDPAKDGYSIPDDGDAAALADSQRKTVEIGWNIPATVKASSLRFKVSMTLHGATTLYDDIATFQWEPVGDSNLVPIGTLNGVVRFPSGIDGDSSWAWLHYTGTSETGRYSDGSLRFTAYDVRAGSYIDLVAAYDADAVKQPSDWSSGDGNWIRRRSGDRLRTLQTAEDEQETTWRDSQRTQARVRLLIWGLVVVAGLTMVAVGLASAIRSYRRSQYQGDIEYWREPPNLSPASAAKMSDIIGLSQGSLDSRQMTATMLSLVSKRALAIYPGPASLYHGIDLSDADNAGLASMIGSDAGRQSAAGTTMTLVILPAGLDAKARQKLRLGRSEADALGLLIAVSKRVGSPVFDLDRMKKACSQWHAGYQTLERYTTSCRNEFAMLGATDSGGGMARVMGVLAVSLSFGAAAVSMVWGNLTVALLLGIPIMIGGVFDMAYAVGAVLTPAGQQYAGQVQGLYRYLTDFSDFTDRGAADIALWDRYLVYAAAFGIADKAMAELAKAYPQVTDPAWLDRHATGSLLYWGYRPYGWRYRYGSAMSGGAAGGAGTRFTPSFDASSFSANFNDIGAQLNSGLADIRSTINAARPQSTGGSGSGGSFGGFGGSGGSFSGGGFGGSSGGSGGGSFGGR
ncbi:DUF2207 domain-containing protein [Bifidobacterium leontopitheci]|uniref:DUF2207 domain-containing protein n=1 Tax=Bifidobacterium leontopitheci TaxID=2650774 RepID=A0A6I1GDN0_9BIFI|nr:DUF2207 domain-containing protein [Bifidobacterium leontopitheci]KAB7789760.1 hypothetical protein F7D09_1758 [Bifidobacterium leontopitheci]